MRNNRARQIALVCLLGLTLMPACGGGDDDGTPSVDASENGTPDAPITNQPDAASNANTGIGQACTPGATPQGDCPNGLICLSLQDGSGPWCSKMCAGQTDMSCGQDYTGPGAAHCLLTVTVDDGSDGGQSFNVCVVMCEDNAGGSYCPACDGTCPDGLACTDTGGNWSGCF